MLLLVAEFIGKFYFTPRFMGSSNVTPRFFEDISQFLLAFFMILCSLNTMHQMVLGFCVFRCADFTPFILMGF